MLQDVLRGYTPKGPAPKYAIKYAMERCVTSIWEHVMRLYDLAQSELGGGGATEEFERLRSELISTAATFDETLSAALLDTPSLHGRRAAWYAWRAALAVFVNALVLWHENFHHVQGLPLSDLMPESRELQDIVKRRLARARRTWHAASASVASTAPDETAPPPELSSRPPPDLIRVPSVLQRAAVVGFVEQLSTMARASTELSAITRVLVGFEPLSRLGRTPIAKRPTQALMFDRDTVVRVARPAVAWVLAFLAWIYLEGVPGGPALLPFMVAVSIAVSVSNLPDVMVFAKPCAIGVLTAAPIYFFVLPHLESSSALFVLLVVYSLPWGYWGSRGDFFGKLFGMLPFLLCSGITNEQSYAFEHFVGSALVIGLALTCISLAGAFLPSSRPERVLLRNLRDFWIRCATFGEIRAGVLRKDLRLEKRASRALRKIIVLAHRLRAPVAALVAAYGPGSRQKHVSHLMSAVELFAHRLEELEAATRRAASEAPEVVELAQALVVQIRTEYIVVLREWARMADGSYHVSTLPALHKSLDEMESFLDEREPGEFSMSFSHQQLYSLFLLPGHGESSRKWSRRWVRPLMPSMRASSRLQRPDALQMCAHYHSRSDR